MSKKQRALAFMGELGLWGFSNVLCLGMSLGATYLAAQAFGLSKLLLVPAMIAVAILTGSWGSWGTLIWTRNRGLRAVQQAVTLIPGLAMLALGGGLLYTGFGAWYMGAVTIAAGLGMSAAAVILAGGIFSKNVLPSKLQYLIGLFVYPLATTALGALIVSMWHGFITSSSHGHDLWSLFSLATLMITILASTLISTIVPALSSRGCQELSQTLSKMPPL